MFMLVSLPGLGEEVDQLLLMVDGPMKVWLFRNYAISTGNADEVFVQSLLGNELLLWRRALSTFKLRET